MSVYPPTSGGEREREVELMCLDGLAWMMLALCCGCRLGLLVLEDTRCLSIASCLVEGFGRNVGFSPNVGWGVRAGSRVDVLGWGCLDDACTLLWASFGLACP